MTDDFPIREKGWECPKCARVWAPKINACGACNARGTLNYVPLKPHPNPPYGTMWDQQDPGSW